MPFYILWLIFVLVLYQFMLIFIVMIPENIGWLLIVLEILETNGLVRQLSVTWLNQKKLGKQNIRTYMYWTMWIEHRRNGAEKKLSQMFIRFNSTNTQRPNIHIHIHKHKTLKHLYWLYFPKISCTVDGHIQFQCLINGSSMCMCVHFAHSKNDYFRNSP